MMDLFPRGVATGEAFYDRVEERGKLSNNIKHGIHTALIAPRRFGKASLMAQVQRIMQHLICKGYFAL